MTPAAKRRARRRLKAEALELENEQLRRLVGDLRLVFDYIDGTAYAGEASPNARDFQRISKAARSASRTAGGVTA
jgi:hypothetical protein